MLEAIIYIFVFFILVCLTVLTSALVKGFLPRTRARLLSEKDRGIVKREGIVHFTTEGNANKIVQGKRLNKCKFLNRHANMLRPCVYFFATGYLDDSFIKYNLSSKNSYGVCICELSEAQLGNLRIRAFDNALIYNGNCFYIDETNEVKIVPKSELKISDIKKSPFKRFAPLWNEVLAALIAVPIVIVTFALVIYIA